jgi:hypothetical protein
MQRRFAELQIIGLDDVAGTLAFGATRRSPFFGRSPPG